MQQYTSLEDGYRAAPYRRSHMTIVRSLAVLQLVMGFLIFFFHIFTTTLNVNFATALKLVKQQLGDPTFLTNRGTADDEIGTGIWTGILIISTASIGISACTEKKRKLVYAHLILNSFVLVAAIFVIATLSVTVDFVSECQTFGAMYKRNDISTISPVPVYFYGEELKGQRGKFYCTDVMFEVWMIMDLIMLGSLVIVMALTTTLVVFNSISIGCCRTCCCRCCHCGQEEPTWSGHQHREFTHDSGLHHTADFQTQTLHTNQQPLHPAPQTNYQPLSPPAYNESEVARHPVHLVTPSLEPIETLTDPSAPEENTEGRDGKHEKNSIPGPT